MTVHTVGYCVNNNNMVGSFLPETLKQQVDGGSVLLPSLTETKIDPRLEPEVFYYDSPKINVSRHIIVSFLTVSFRILLYRILIVLFFCYDKRFRIDTIRILWSNT